MAFLVSNDNNEKFPIPDGETAIGRGPYLRVKELSLSRSHALLSMHDGKLSIKPTHKNPTYFYSSVDDEQQVLLDKDEWKDLVDGDQISLMADSYKYKIEIKLQTSAVDSACIEQKNYEGKKIYGAMMEETQPIEYVDKENQSSAVNKTVLSSLQEVISPNRKRKLPAWMMDTELATVKKKTPAARKIPPKPKATPKKEVEKTTKVCTKVSAGSPTRKKSKSVDDEIKDDDALVDSGKKSYDAEPIIKPSPTTEKRSTSSSKGNGNTVDMDDACKSFKGKDDDEISNNSCSMLEDNEEPIKEAEIVPLNEDENSRSSFSILNEEENKRNMDTTDDACQDERSNDSFSMLDQEDQCDSALNEKNIVDEDDNSNHSFSMLNNDEDETVQLKEDVLEEKDKTAAATNAQKQGSSSDIKRCPYGKRCYRKNPVHFTEFSHDTDDEEEGDNSAKSECPYGLKCYRQGNPHHTNQYTHTSIGKQRRARKTRKQRTKKKKSVLDKDSDNDGENQYDMNDSFLASSDESSSYSDDGSDSDYKPYGKDDDDDDEEESEDVKELLAEAKGFLKNKKM